MAPIKFEDEIKEKLQKREIAPSKNAWEKISSTLETPQNKRTKGFIWYAVAASFIGILIVSTLVFNSSGSIPGKGVEIVDEPLENKVEKSKTEIIAPLQQEEVYATVEEVAPVKQNTIKKNKKEVKNIEQQTVAVTQENQSSMLNKSLSDTEKLIDSKIAEVIAKVNLLEKDNDLLTDMEVDSLLRKAQTEILTNKIFMENQKVDALALLSEVEDELDHSFRDQIFESLKSGFIKVRTAVADRNN
ncbi:putative transporter YbjL [Saonia flava]|uniref:Putative transporter YbjL n=1 Tax=Saonia flava TaxID=523696 RepID=A0A846QP27_9FLAO|nr:hypothetical protein [Saonia flava]NJB70816.1 putative transporter YbjL [Saonia flava]